MFFTFQKEPHHGGETKENQKLTKSNKQNPNQSFNEDKNDKQTRLVFSTT
jgi:hypothetical protein